MLKTQSIIVAGLFVALGLILPYFTAHAFGLPGTILLPMHIPVLLAGLLCGPLLGALAGVITPVLSSILTGMPAPYPMLPIMTVQLCAIGFVSGLMYRKFKVHLYISLISAMIAGWALYGLVFAMLLFTADGPLRALSVPAALMTGLPGLIIQLTIIPVIITVLKKYAAKFFHDNYKSSEYIKQDAVLKNAVELIKGGEISCVVINKGEIVHTADGRGVSPLLDIFVNHKDKLKGAFVVDKIIGKAAAMILVSGGARRAYGLVMSAGGLEYLGKHGVIAEYAERVDVISNRDGSDMCPIEKSVLDTDDSLEGLQVIGRTLDSLKKV